MRADLDRVKGNIRDIIVDFFQRREGTGELRFRNRDLLNYVWGKGVECAPDSPARIMRDLSSEGCVSYRVVDRSGSEYLIQPSGQGRLF